jgi:hypothetical protein
MRYYHTRNEFGVSKANWDPEGNAGGQQLGDPPHKPVTRIIEIGTYNTAYPRWDAKSESLAILNA